MEIVKATNLSSMGRFIVIYSETGEGKTTSCYQSLPGRILNIVTEPRNPAGAIEASGRNPDDIDVIRYTDWFSLLDYLSDILANPDDYKEYGSLFLDSLSFLMNVSLSSEIENETYDAKTIAEQKIKPIINMAKMSLEGYGGMSSQMGRLMKLLGLVSASGKVVVVTCLLDEKPKWDRELSAGPALAGREFPRNFPGFVDMIGLVTPRYQRVVQSDGTYSMERVFPPKISFEGDGGFLCKYSGPRPAGVKVMQGILDFNKILGGSKTIELVKKMGTVSGAAQIQAKKDAGESKIKVKENKEKEDKKEIEPANDDW